MTLKSTDIRERPHEVRHICLEFCYDLVTPYFSQIKGLYTTSGVICYHMEDIGSLMNI